MLGFALLVSGVGNAVVPDLVGVVYRDGVLVGVGSQSGPGVTIVSPPWLAAALIAGGVLVTLVTHWLVRATLRAWRSRHILRWRDRSADSVAV